MKRIFLLGGHDLEMLTIRDLLDQYQVICFDRQLTWDTALLSAYQDVLDSYGNDNTYYIYGIELRLPVNNRINTNYKLIDHHNEYSDNPSALIQVADILGHTLTRYEQLVAANDSTYIPGMQAMGATEREIEDIRYKDRKAQGVTAEDEKSAEKAVKGKKDVGELTVIYSKTSRFSPITDRLYPYKNLLVYTDKEWMFYGNKAKEVYTLFSELIKTESMFYGGVFSFLGVPNNLFSKTEIEQMVNLIIEQFKI